MNGKLSGIRIPDDIILRQSFALQNFYEPLTFTSNVNIIGTLSISDTINERFYNRICDLIQPNEHNEYRLHVDGKKVFDGKILINVKFK